jgi:hypothetical protein
LGRYRKGEQGEAAKESVEVPIEKKTWELVGFSEEIIPFISSSSAVCLEG